MLELYDINHFLYKTIIHKINNTSKFILLQSNKDVIMIFNTLTLEETYDGIYDGNKKYISQDQLMKLSFIEPLNNKIIITKLREVYDLDSLKLYPYFDQIETINNYMIDVDDELNSQTLPNHLKELFLNKYYKDLTDFPKSLRLLSIDQNKNHIIDNLPNTLNEICLPEDYDRPLPKLPNGLKKLEIFGIFNQPLGKLPSGLKELNLSEKFNYPLDNLPKNLKIFSIESKGQFSHPLQNLPNSIESIVLNENYTQNITFPKSLKKLFYDGGSGCDFRNQLPNCEIFDYFFGIKIQ